MVGDAIIVALLLVIGTARLIAFAHWLYMEWTAGGRAGRWTRHEPT